MERRVSENFEDSVENPANDESTDVTSDIVHLENETPIGLGSLAVYNGYVEPKKTKGVTMRQRWKTIVLLPSYVKGYKNYTSANKRLFQLANMAAEFMKILGGHLHEKDTNDKVKEKMADILSKMLKDKELWSIFVKKLKEDTDLIKVFHQWTPEEASQFQTKMCMTFYSRRKFSRLLKALTGVNILPSEVKQRQYELKQRKLTSEGKVDVGCMLLYKTAQAEYTTMQNYIQMNDLGRTIADLYKEEVNRSHITDNSVHVHPDDPVYKGKVWVILADDKGGSSMMYSLQIGIHGQMTVVGMYNATDNFSNSLTFFGPMSQQLEIVRRYGFLITNEEEEDEKISKEIELFLVGDKQFKYVHLGLSGACGKYPSEYSLVSLEHLQKSHRDGSPHVPDKCPVKYRDIAEMEQNWRDCQLDKRKKPAKHHESQCGPVILRLSSIWNVVPSSLHIELGIVLAATKEMEKDAEFLDWKEVSDFTSININLIEGEELSMLHVMSCGATAEGLNLE